MPYIRKENRAKYNGYIRTISNMLNRIPKGQKAGHLNYIITKLLHLTVPVRYNDFNSLIGMLECCKMELYRRKIAPYENIKIEQNGDI